jgi:hypothetical protein
MIISNVFRFIFYLISTKLNEWLSLFVLIAALHFVLLLDMFFLFKKTLLMIILPHLYLKGDTTGCNE